MTDIVFSTPPLLDHTQIAARIPHAGRMCLLDWVSSWDARQIVCGSVSHRAADHPLRASDGSLGIAAGIEYAAQAIAVHGSLLAKQASESAGSQKKPPAGMLTSVRGIEMHVSSLDQLVHDLRIEAVQVVADARALVYSFALYEDEVGNMSADMSTEAGRQCKRLLLNGRASVLLLADAG